MRSGELVGARTTRFEARGAVLDRCRRRGAKRLGAGRRPAPIKHDWVSSGAYQLLPEQPLQERVTLPLASLMMENVLFDFDVAVTV